MTYPSEAEARLALHDVERARRRMIEQIGMPWWYWWGLAAAWASLGALSDVDVPWWALSTATLAVGAVHATVAQRVLAGRQQRRDVRVGADLAGRRVTLIVLGLLVALVGVTVGVGFGLHADGAGHPATWAGGLGAALIVLCGPRLMAWIRDDAAAA